ncbi:MAG: PaaI family thioesterase [Sphingomonadaceae bacterium]
MSETVARQPGSRHCYVCGRENPIGLKVQFFQDGDRVFTRFTPGPEHQGYPDRMHGGIASTLLDETIGRAGFVHGFWTFTAKFEVKYRKPIPLGQEITVVGEMVRDRGRIVEARGRILLADGSVAVEGSGLFVKLTPEELEGFEETLGQLE